MNEYEKIKAENLYFSTASNMHPANTYFHFSFANYRDPRNQNFGVLRVVEGIYDIRENFKASKMFIEFNESEVDETRLFSKIKKVGAPLNIEISISAGAMDMEIIQHKNEMRYRLRILSISIVFSFIIAPISWFIPDSFERNFVLFFLAAANFAICGSFFLNWRI